MVILKYLGLTVKYCKNNTRLTVKYFTVNHCRPSLCCLNNALTASSTPKHCHQTLGYYYLKSDLETTLVVRGDNMDNATLMRISSRGRASSFQTFDDEDDDARLLLKYHLIVCLTTSEC